MRYHGAEMSDADFCRLRDTIYKEFGVYFEEEKKYLLDRRLAPRLEATGAATFAEYLRLLRYGERGRRELQEVIDRVVVNETYFFREAYQLRAFTDEILPAIWRDAQRRTQLTIWSAGCSSGEEPYTISMLLLETGLFHDWDVRIVGSDVSRRVLATASRAHYRDSALRETSEERRQRFFRKMGREHEVKEVVRAPVSFAHLNLLDGDSSELIGDVDVLFCRNVLIYFDAPMRERVLKLFYDRLVPGGYLLLGHAETLINVSTAFELVQLQNDSVYRKPRSAA